MKTLFSVVIGQDEKGYHADVGSHRDRKSRRFLNTSLGTLLKQVGKAISAQDYAIRSTPPSPIIVPPGFNGAKKKAIIHGRN